MATAPPTINALPAPPDPNDRSTFNTRAYPWSVAQQTLATEVGAVATNVYNNALDAAGSAVSATNQVTLATEQAVLAQTAANSASATVGATQWVSGTTYAAGYCVWSPINQQVYRRKIAGAGTTDPSSDATNWTQLGGGSPSLPRSARTSNTVLGEADAGKLIDITSGTFAQTFDAVATLGDGWYCYIKNSGTGDITLEPNASEAIDGLTSYIMYPGEVRLLQCDGVALRTVVLNSFYKTFTASGSFTKPPGYTAFDVMLWGGGGSGRRGASSSARMGGGGGGCAVAKLHASIINSTESVTIGAGGADVTVNSTNGNDGGDSTFSILAAFGGKGGTSSSGDGGSAFLQGTLTSSSVQIYAGSDGSTSALYGGGSGENLSTSQGNTVYGGAGGAALDSSNTLRAISKTVFGGAGGATSGAGGIAPGGGGSASADGAASGAGARGELRIWGKI